MLNYMDRFCEEHSKRLYCVSCSMTCDFGTGIIFDDNSKMFHVQIQFAILGNDNFFPFTVTTINLCI